MNSKESLIFENSLDSRLEMSLYSNYILESFDGRNGLENEISTSKNMGQHGESFINATLGMRYITLTGKIFSNNLSELKQYMIKTMNPTLDCTLTYVHADKPNNRVIDCKVESCKITTDKRITTFTIKLICPSPFLKEVEKIERLALFMPLFKFPLSIAKVGGMMFGAKANALESEINNVGQVKSGFRVILKASAGTVKNPIVKNNITGQKIKINYQMQKDDIIEILNYPNQKKILINSTVNGFKYLDVESEFFDIEIGKNLIGYEADENTVNLDVIMYYSPLYLGV